MGKKRKDPLPIGGSISGISMVSKQSRFRIFFSKKKSIIDKADNDRKLSTDFGSMKWHKS